MPVTMTPDDARSIVRFNQWRNQYHESGDNPAGYNWLRYADALSDADALREADWHMRESRFWLRTAAPGEMTPEEIPAHYATYHSGDRDLVALVTGYVRQHYPPGAPRPGTAPGGGGTAAGSASGSLGVLFVAGIAAVGLGWWMFRKTQ